MSQRRKREPAAARGPAAQSSLELPAHPEAPTPARRVLLVLVAALLGLWSVALALMALFTSNPAVVSGDQIRRAEIVVVGRPIEGRRERFRVERVLAGDVEAGTELTVLNLSDLPALSPRESYVLPLSPFRGDYQVTRLGPMQQAPPLIYPAVQPTIDQVKQILSEVRR